MRKKPTYTVIDGFSQISFRSYQQALEYCHKFSLPVNNIFIDER